MKYLKFYALLALLLMAGGVTTHAQTEDDFWMEINPPTTGICSLIVDSEGNIIVGATGVYCSRDGGITWGLIGLEECGILCLYEHTDGICWQARIMPIRYTKEKPEARNGGFFPFLQMRVAFLLVSQPTIPCLLAHGMASINRQTGTRLGPMSLKTRMGIVWWWIC